MNNRFLVISVCIFLIGAAQYGMDSGLLFGWNETRSVPVIIDNTTRTIVTEEYEHYEVHDSDTYQVSDKATVNDTATRMFLIVTPNTTNWAHLVYDVSGTGVTTIEFFESTARVGGTATTEGNRNRNGTDSAAVVITHTPGAGADGTLIYSEKFGLATGPNARQAGTSREEAEWVLGQNKSYLLKITSGTDGNEISTKLRWYELTDRN